MRHYLFFNTLSARWKITLVGLLAGALTLRMVAMARMILIPEEAYYWMYAQHPDWSYFDHPPMVAWSICLGTRLFGNTEFGVRIINGLLMLASSGLMYAFSRIWFGREASVFAALLLQVLPVYFGAGLIATMDGTLIFFWLLALLGLSLTIQRRRTWGWYLTGVGVGAAMLCKYTGVFLGLGCLLTTVGYRPWRCHLTTIHPYLAALLAFTMFIPVLIWNTQHEWASFRFQFVDRFAGNGLGVTHVVLFILFQIMVATPGVLMCLGLFYARTLSKLKRLLRPRRLISVSFSLPFLLAVSYKSLRYDVHMNWTLPLYLSVLPAITQWLLVRCRRIRGSGTWWQRSALGTLVGCLILNVLAMSYVLILEPKLGRISALGPWRELAAAVQKVADGQQKKSGHEPLIAAEGKNRLASVLAFYRTPLEQDVRASDFTTSQWIIGGSEGLGYPYWADWDQWLNSDIVLIYQHIDPAKITARMESFSWLEDIGIEDKRYHVAVGHLRRK